MLDPHRLRIFRSVVASGSVQAAADHLLLTSSAVSQQLTRLQEETGLTLFRRAGRGIEPTDAAYVLAEESDELMAHLERLDRVVVDLREGRSGRLVIGYFSSAGQAWMPALVRRLVDESPDLTVELVLTEDAPSELMPDLDLVVLAPGSPGRTGYRRVPLVDDPYVAVLPADHPLASRRRISLVDLRGGTWVSNDELTRPTHRLLVSACAAAGLRPRFAVQAEDQDTAMAFVAAGLGVTVLPRLAASAPPQGVRRLPLDPPVPVREVSVLVREGVTRHQAAGRAVELLTDLVRPRVAGRRRPRGEKAR